MNAQDYEDQVLTVEVPPLMRKIESLYGDGNALYQEDGNSAHGLKNTHKKALKKELGIHLLNEGKWPPSSPDLSRIENIWRLIKQRINAKRGGIKVLKLEDLKRAFQVEWDALTQEDIRKWINMKERLH